MDHYSGRIFRERKMRLGLRGKITLLGLGLTFLVALSGLVGYRYTHQRMLAENLRERGMVLGKDLALQSEGYLVRGSDIELRELVERFAAIKGVSYILITDQQGRVRANTLRDRRRIALITEGNGEGSSQVTSKGRYELAIPILEGTLGTVYLGLSPLVQKPMDYWIIGFLGGALLFSWILIFLFAQRLSKRLLWLAQVTERVSLGSMEEGITMDSEDEIGRLAQATDRLRISLQTALERLGKGASVGRA